MQCQPLWDGNRNTYSVSVTFDGKTRAGSESVLATSRADLGVMLFPVEGALSGEAVVTGQAGALEYDAGRSDSVASYFAKRFLVGLQYYPDSNEKGGGAFESVVTYTITIDH